MIAIDGSAGEGGGQVLRTALALSLVTGRPFRIERIRGRRANPGLQRQHLTSVEAAAAIGAAEVQGAALGSSTVEFRPGPVKAGDYRFAVGTAGSTTLVLQTVLPALLTAPAPSTVVIEGGTHNPFAPPFEFLARVFLPLLARMGAAVDATLDRPGFYSAGGGQITVRVAPGPRPLSPLALAERGASAAGTPGPRSHDYRSGSPSGSWPSSARAWAFATRSCRPSISATRARAPATR